VLTFPFDVTKSFMSGDRATAMVEQVGGTWGPVALNVHLIDLAFLPLLGLWLMRRMGKRERIRFPRTSYVPLACFSFMTLTSMVAPSPYFAFLALLKQWKYFVIYIFAVDVLDSRRLRTAFLAILVLTVVLQGALTIARYRLQYFEPFFGDSLGRLSTVVVNDATRSVTTDTADSRLRGFGTFYHPNPTAMHLELLLPFVLILALSSPTWRWKLAYASVFALGAAGLYFTFSRAGMVAFLVSMLTCVLVASLRGLIPRRALMPIAGALLFAGLGLVPMLVKLMQSRPEYSASHMEHLQQAVIIALRHPIFGVGLNNSSLVRPYLVPGGVTDEDSQLPLHSGHLLGLAETGVIGFGLYLGFFVLIWIEAWQQSKSQDVLTRTFSIGIIGAYTAMAIHMTTDYLGVESFNALVWMYAGIVVAQRRWPERLGTTAGARMTDVRQPHMPLLWSR
jgi:hypothetical protein